MDLVEQQYWDDGYSNIILKENDGRDPIIKLLKEHIPLTEIGSVLEIGCFPGRYLQTFGDLGYIINGVDTTPRTAKDLKNYLIQKKYKIGQLLSADIFDFKAVQKFDVVCSFGFIEHFKNWQEVISMHLDHIKPGGLIIITVPNFSGLFQQMFHRIFDAENLNRHNLKAMNTKAWINYLKREHYEFSVLFEGPFGNIEFWTDNVQQKGVRGRLMGYAKKIIHNATMKNLKPSNLYSPYKALIIKVDA